VRAPVGGVAGSAGARNGAIDLATCLRNGVKTFGLNTPQMSGAKVGGPRPTNYSSRVRPESILWDTARVRSGVSIYFTFRSGRLILLLAGGDKGSQERDIILARSMIERLEKCE
ncbi:MAG: hypothetical protein WBO04_08970, partial [Steroidobacteraceae bacterium]